VIIGTRIRWQVRGHQLQVKRALIGDSHRCFDHPRVPLETFGLLVAGAQVGDRRSRQPPIVLLQRSAMANRSQCGSQLAMLLARIADVICCKDGEVAFEAQPGEHIVSGATHRRGVIPQFDRKVRPPESGDEIVQDPLRSDWPLGFDRSVERPVVCAGEHPPMPAGKLGEAVEGVLGGSLLPRHLPFADRPSKPGVPLGPAGEDHDVSKDTLPLATNAELSAKHGEQPMSTSSFSEPHDPVEAVSVGEG